MFLHERMSVGIDVWASKVLLSAVKFKLFTFLGDAPAARPPRAPSLVYDGDGSHRRHPSTKPRIVVIQVRPAISTIAINPPKIGAENPARKTCEVVCDQS